MSKNKENFSQGALDDCAVEQAIKNGHQRKRCEPATSIPKLPKGYKRRMQSPLIHAFGLDENGE